MKKKKIIIQVLLVSIWISIMLLFVREEAEKDRIRTERNNVETSVVEEINNRQEVPVYLVESMDNLHLGEAFDLSNYYIRNKCDGSNRYYIDSNNVLWGYGYNEYGQLGNGQQKDRDEEGNFIFEKIPQRMAEDVIHVDFKEYFVIFLTETGELYGVGANLNGVMGLSVDGKSIAPSENVVTEPVCLMQDVLYARSSQRGIVALKRDGSVWWWGDIRTTSAKNINDTEALSYEEPKKMLDNAIYVTSGSFGAAAIKEDGTLWTWGNNTFGSCGYDSGGKDFVEDPVKVLEDVKMVWMDEVSFDSIEEQINYGYVNPSKCHYTYVTFVEKKDGSLWACGYEVEGEGSKSWTYMYYGDILRTSEKINGSAEETPVTVSYSDIFQEITLCEEDRTPQLQFRDLKFGQSSEEVISFLEGLGISYKIVDGISEEEKVYMITIEDYYFSIYFDEEKKIESFHYDAYGTRNGEINIGMPRGEVERILGECSFDEISPDNDKYVTAIYQDEVVYEIGYFDGKVCNVEERMIEAIPEDIATWEEAYKDIICKIEDNLVDPYSLRSDVEQYVYIGVHDFDNDGIPELVIGDGVSVAVFGYVEKQVKKLADLYVPETWGAINGLSYKNNTVTLGSSGSDGSCYVCFTYKNGDYVIGTYDEYNPQEAIVDEMIVDKETFDEYFDLAELWGNNRITYIQKKNEPEVLLEIGSEKIPVSDLDFNTIMW